MSQYITAAVSLAYAVPTGGQGENPDYVVDTCSEKLLALLPHGPAWPRDSDANIVLLAQGLSREFSRVDQRMKDLALEFDPRTIDEMLPDQETDWQLPDPWYAQLTTPLTVSQRRANLQRKMIGFSDPSFANIEADVYAVIGAKVRLDKPYTYKSMFSSISNSIGALYTRQWLSYERMFTFGFAASAIDPTHNVNTTNLGSYLDARTQLHALRVDRYLFARNFSGGSSAPSGAWSDIIWSNTFKRFVAVASSGTNRTMYAADDKGTWTAVAPPEANPWVSVAVGPNLYATVGTPDYIFAVATSGTHQLMGSADGGLTWVAVSAAEAATWNDLCYGAGVTGTTTPQFVAVGSSGTHRIMRTSNPASAWVTATAPELNTWTAVDYSPKLDTYVAVSSDGTHRVMWSPDGATWTLATAAEQNPWTEVKWCSSVGLFVATATSGTHNVMTSPDGKVWTQRAIGVGGPVTPTAIVDVPGVGVIILVAENAPNYNWYTFDGVTWNIYAPSWSGPGDVNITAAAWSDALGDIAIVNASGTYKVSNIV